MHKSMLLDGCDFFVNISIKEYFTVRDEIMYVNLDERQYRVGPTLFKRKYMKIDVKRHYTRWKEAFKC